jgi:hypothetical protein
MSTPNNVPQDVVRIFNREGYEIAKFQTSVSRSWAIGEEGRAQFTYASRKSDIVNESVLQFGNWLLVENSQIDSWIGIIDVPREWNSRDVTVSAYGAERLFSFRRGPLELVLNATPGGIFGYLIQLTNAAETTRLRWGNLWRGGKAMQETLNPTPLSEDLRRVVERSGEEYAFRAGQDDTGRLVVYGDWVQRLGADTPCLLQEGKGGGNVEAVGRILVEDGPIVNDELAYGDGMTWTTKPNVIVADPASRAKYGLRQDGQEWDGVTSVTTLISNSTERLRALKNPLRTFRLNAINVGDTFQYMHLGNVVNVRLQNVGFGTGGLGYESRVRIIGMSYDPAMKNKLSLVVEELV